MGSLRKIATLAERTLIVENQNTVFQIDVCYEASSPWEALAQMWADFDSWEDILNVRYLPNVGSWPVFEITTTTEETARAILGVYLGTDPDDEEVTECLGVSA